MLTRKLNELPDGIRVGGDQNQSGAVSKVDCLGVSTIKNCIDPTALGDPITLNFYNQIIIPQLIPIPVEWNIRVVPSTPFSIFFELPTAFFMDMVVESNGLISATITSGPNNNLSWTINANIGGIKKDISLNNQTWNPTSTLHFTENGTASLAQFAVTADGDEIDIRATTTTGPALVFHFNLTRRNGSFIIDAYYKEG